MSDMGRDLTAQDVRDALATVGTFPCSGLDRVAEHLSRIARPSGGVGQPDTPWQILAPEGPSARRDGYAVVTADWSADADRAEYYVAEQMTREVAEMLVRAGSVSPDDALTTAWKVDE